MFEPKWKQHEKDMSSNDPKKAVKATEAFEAEREFEIKNDPKAKRWEEGRKKDLAKQKPDFVKRRIQKEKDEQERPIKNLLNGGIFERFRPMPGHVLVEVDPEERTESGIYVNVTGQEPNTGVLLAVGKPVVCRHDFAKSRYQTKDQVTTHCDANEGDRVMFKRLAGMEVTVGTRKCRLMSFYDLLAVI